MAIEYYILDTETTGLKEGFHDLVEISIIRCSSKVQLTRIIKAENPRNASFDALKITGKTMKDLYNGIDKDRMIDEVNDFFKQDSLTPAHRCVVAHNAAFDRRFLHHTWEAIGKQFPAELWLDTLAVCKKITKAQGLVKPKLNLHAACDLFEIKKFAGAHTAKSDTRNTYLLWKKFVDDGTSFIDLIKRIPHLESNDEII